MTWARALIVIALASAAAAAVVALSSRAPADLRRAEPSPSDYEPALGARFTETQRERAGAYRRPSYAFVGASILLQAVVLIVLARGPIHRLAASVGGSWTGIVAVAVAIAAVLFVALVPASFVRGFVVEHAWGLSTQDATGWIADKAKSLGLAAVTSALAALAFVGIVRVQPRLWWLWGWIGFTIMTAVLAYLWPVVVAPLFNRFEPLRNESLEQGIRSVAAAAGIEVDRVLVADASRRTRAENAYVAGLSNTKRVVLYDNLIAPAEGDEADHEDEVLFVVAHELGHVTENHVLKGIALSSGLLLVGFSALFLLAGRGDLTRWAGAADLGDVRALPLVALVAVVGGVLATPVHSVVSRSFESRADQLAFELTSDTGAAVRMFRRLALVNIADLDPPAALEWVLFSHPSIPTRIERALEYRASSP